MAKKTKPTTSKTLVTMLLDRSGSMASIKSQTLEAINAYLIELRQSVNDIRFSLVQFDTDDNDRMALEKVHVGVPVKDVPDLTDADFHPRGMTPLLDAIQTTMSAVEASLVGKKDIKTIFVIQTDGHENASKEASWEGVQNLINAKTKAGWEILFMGAGLKQATYAMADKLGVTRERTVSYGKNLEETRAAFAATGANIRNFSEGMLADTSYSRAQKLESGDNEEDAIPAFITGLSASQFPTPKLGAPVAPGNIASPARPAPINPGNIAHSLQFNGPSLPLDLTVDTHPFALSLTLEPDEKK